jgi:predicted nucleic-acid-binding Zn-ribbon protein
MGKVGEWKCPKCGSEDYRLEELMMTGRHGVIGRGYRFNVFICQKCGYSELYYREKTIVTG